MLDKNLFIAQTTFEEGDFSTLVNFEKQFTAHQDLKSSKSQVNRPSS